jgi:glycosyltransferase involved in cell wall biosynthesis
MKLLVVSSWFPYPPDNGSKLRAFNLLSRLSKRHEITLLTFAEPGEGQERTPLDNLCASIQMVAGNPFKPAAALRARDLFSMMPRSYAQTYSPTMQALVDGAIHGHDAAVAFELGSALYLARHSIVPRVFDEPEAGVIHDQYRRQPQGQLRWRRGLTWWKFGRFLRRLVDSFERTTAVSDVEVKLLEQIGCCQSSLRIVPNGVDRHVMQHRNAPRPGRLIYPGSITFSANLEAVRFFTGDILPRIRRARPDTSLVVTGSTGDIDVRPLIAGGGVTFTGRVPDIARLVAHSAACVVPLKTGGGTRLKILEAMAVGTPVIATTKGAEGLAVTHGEDILIADSPETFAAEVVRLMGDCVLRARLAANGRRLVERLYTWDRIGDEFENVLEEAQAVHSGRTATRPGSRDQVQLGDRLRQR